MSASAIAHKRLDRRTKFATKKGSSGLLGSKGDSPTRSKSVKRAGSRARLSKSGIGTKRSGLRTKRDPATINCASHVNDNGGIPVKVGDSVYIRDEDKGSAEVFLRARVVSIDAGLQLNLKTQHGEFTKPGAQVFIANTSADTPGDHFGLIYMNEPCILENTRARFAKDEPYTFVSRVLVAMNPFKKVDGLYGQAMMDRFKAKSSDPHVYAVAEVCRQPSAHRTTDERS